MKTADRRLWASAAVFTQLKLLTKWNFAFKEPLPFEYELRGCPFMVPDRFALLADPSLPGKYLVALKRIAEALESGFLTLEEAKRAVARIAPPCAPIFNDAAHAQAVILAIEMILQERYPSRFRANVRR